MSKSIREIPKAIAAFGEKQFKETGASAVEVLRVKAAVMRKHFHQLKGILFLVAVISLDRVRVYFFNAAGVMVIGENIEHSIYDKVRKSSKLVAKFEKPRPLTPEELRIEATRELRDALGKAIRRVSRFLALKEPPFPDIYVTRSKSLESSQCFGLQISDDSELLFEEKAVSQKWVEGLLLRAAFLVHLNRTTWYTEAANSIGNALGYSLLKDPVRQSWLQEWRKQSKETSWMPIVSHFIIHTSTYSHENYNWIRSIINQTSKNLEINQCIEILTVVHDSLLIPLSTEDYHIIMGFCNSLTNPRQVEKRRYTLDSIHLEPRVLCNPSPLGTALFLSIIDNPNQNSWAQVRHLVGKKLKSLEINPDGKEPITSIEYWLNLEDIYPSSEGPLSHGRDIIRRALEKIGISKLLNGTFEVTLTLNEDLNIDAKERAVLERLVLGKTEILTNTLVGSPMILSNLVQKGCVNLVPDFYHLGINQDYLLYGSYESVRSVARTTLEATIFRTLDNAYAVVSAPSSWKQPLISVSIESDIEISSVVSVKSERKLLRDEMLFSNDDLFQWNAGPS